MLEAQAKFNSSELLEKIHVGTSNTFQWQGKEIPVAAVPWQAPVTGSIYGVVFNFKAQRDGFEKYFTQKPYQAPPKRPVMYIKPRNTVNAHLHSIPVPKHVDALEMNGTLGVVIGRDATNVMYSEAMDYVKGYTIVNDVTVPHDSMYRPQIYNKVRDGFCPTGPWIIDKNQISSISSLKIATYINGSIVHESRLDCLIRPIEQLIQDVTSFMTLFAGDMLLVGLPHAAPTAAIGDRVTITIDQMGSLENQLVEEEAYQPGGERK